MQVTFYGVRGSLPTPGPETARYGGNTSCIDILGSSGERLIVDAGTGIRKLGSTLPPEGTCRLLLSHTHWDHIVGLPFFSPLFTPGWKIDLYVPKGNAGVLSMLLNGHNFPLYARDLPAEVCIREYQAGQTLEFGEVRVETFPMPHPGGGTGLRLIDDWTLALSGDCELNEKTHPRIVEPLLHDAHIAVVDGQYSECAYRTRRGWGHSAREAWLEPARSAGVRNLLFTHHDMDSTDTNLDCIGEELQLHYGHKLPHIFMATEGSTLIEGKPHVRTLS